MLLTKLKETSSAQHLLIWCCFPTGRSMSSTIWSSGRKSIKGVRSNITLFCSKKMEKLKWTSFPNILSTLNLQGSPLMQSLSAYTLIKAYPTWRKNSQKRKLSLDIWRSSSVGKTRQMKKTKINNLKMVFKIFNNWLLNLLLKNQWKGTKILRILKTKWKIWVLISISPSSLRCTPWSWLIFCRTKSQSGCWESSLCIYSSPFLTPPTEQEMPF